MRLQRIDRSIFQSTSTLRARPVDDPDEETKHPLPLPQGNGLVQLENKCHNTHCDLGLLDDRGDFHDR